MMIDHVGNDFLRLLSYNLMSLIQAIKLIQ